MMICKYYIVCNYYYTLINLGAPALRYNLKPTTMRSPKLEKEYWVSTCLRIGSLHAPNLNNGRWLIQCEASQLFE